MKKYKLTDLETGKEELFSNAEWNLYWGLILLAGIGMGGIVSISLFMLFCS